MKQMNEALKHRIEVHRQDFESVERVPFKHFYCPLLHLDENVPLQKGHVVNQSLNDAASDWVVQRQDIDGWYGTHFEADFKKVQDRQRILDRPSDLLTDPRLNKDHRPILMVGGARVEHTPKELPKEAPFVRFGIRHGDEVSHTNIKVALGELDNVMKQSWEVVYEADYRIQALVTLLKSAYLTMFRMLGYRYVFSPGGILIGRDLLGSFYRNNRSICDRDRIKRNALEHFREFQFAVRLAIAGPREFEGSVKDKE